MESGSFAQCSCRNIFRYNLVHTIFIDLVNAIERIDYEECEDRTRERKARQGNGSKKTCFPAQNEEACARDALHPGE
jgi:hypothetical protein